MKIYEYPSRWRHRSDLGSEYSSTYYHQNIQIVTQGTYRALAAIARHHYKFSRREMNQSQLDARWITVGMLMFSQINFKPNLLSSGSE